jgi:hypothetical protein
MGGTSKKVIYMLDHGLIVMYIYPTVLPNEKEKVVRIMIFGGTHERRLSISLYRRDVLELYNALGRYLEDTERKTGEDYEIIEDEP